LEISSDGLVQVYSFVGFFLILAGPVHASFPLKTCSHSAHAFVQMAELIS
jgi:hypothetical protein